MATTTDEGNPYTADEENLGIFNARLQRDRPGDSSANYRPELIRTNRFYFSNEAINELAGLKKPGDIWTPHFVWDGRTQTHMPRPREVIMWRRISPLPQS